LLLLVLLLYYIIVQCVRMSLPFSRLFWQCHLVEYNRYDLT